MCKGAPGYTVQSGDGLECIFSGIPIPFFNVGLLTARGISGHQLDALAREARAFAADMRVPWLFVSTHEAMEPGVDANAILEECGFAPLMPMTGMVADRVASPVAIPAGLELSRPTDEDGCSTILDINSVAYAMDLGAGKGQLGKPSFWNGHFPVVGRVRGAPAVTASVIMVDGIRYVALVATDPAHQRRGYADAAMRRALELASAVHNDSPTVLHATEAGRPVYARMGYRPLSSHTLYIEQQYLPAH